MIGSHCIDIFLHYLYNDTIREKRERIMSRIVFLFHEQGFCN